MATAAALWCLNASAQAPIAIERIEVVGTQRAANIATTRTLIDSAALQSKATNSFAELLARSTPVFVKSYGLGSLATVSFRGTAASHTGVEWNGININSPMLGQVDFSSIPVWFVDRAELLHGGSSLHGGSGALGGSVIVSSVPRWDKSIYGSAAVGAGSFGTYTALASIGGGSRKFQIRARYIYQRAKNDFEFVNTAVPPFETQKQQNADYSKHGATVDMFLNAGKGHVVAISGWYHNARRNLPTIMSYEGRGREEWQRDSEARVVGRWSYYGRGIKSELVSGFSATKTDYFLANLTDLGSIVNMDSRSEVQSVQNRYKIQWSPWGERTMFRGQLNVDVHNVETLDRITAEGYAAHRLEAGLSLSAHHFFSAVWSGFVLARVEERGVFMPSVGVQAEPVKGFLVKFNATRNYHRPTLNDLYWLPGGNPALRPERGFTGDISVGYEFTKGRLTGSVDVNGYAGLIDDWIVWRPSEFRYWTAENIKTVFTRGVELNARVEYTTSYGLTYGVRANYAFTRTTNQDPTLNGDQSSGKQLIYIPVHKANVSGQASWRWLYATWAWEYTGERFTTSSQEATRHRLPSYNLHGFTLGAKAWSVDLELKIDNIFDTKYQAILWRAMPGRSFSAMVRYTF